MKECVRKYFIYDDELIKAERFDKQQCLTGISVYDVIRIVDGKPLFFIEHLERLYSSVELSGFNSWLSPNDISKKICQLLTANKITDGNIKLLLNFTDRQQEGEKHFFAYFIQHKYPSSQQYENGVETILFHAERYKPNAKIIHKLLKAETEKLIEEHQVYEVFLVNRENEITEGSKSNLFLIKGNKIFTTPKTEVLKGITRDKVFALCEKTNIELLEEKIQVSKLKHFDAAFITGTSPKILPICRIENIKYDVQNQLLRKIMYEYDVLMNQSLEKAKAMVDCMH